MKKYEKSLFIFRRDLRLQDNTGLQKALKFSKEVIPCFIFDPRQIEKNTYRSEKLITFMHNSLDELDKRLKERKSKLHFFYGKADEVVKNLIEKEKIDCVFFNKDYTPFSKKRDKAIEKVCEKQEVECFSYHDALLCEPDALRTGQGNPYTVFTPFAKKAKTLGVTKSEKNNSANYGQISSIKKESLFKKVQSKKDVGMLKGGREEGLKLLKDASKLKDYYNTRNLPSINGTSKLSAHLKFGTISVREAYWEIHKNLGKDHGLINEFYWRDFFTHISYHFPRVLEGRSFRPKYDKLNWENDKKKFKAWCEGKTGFPIVDAGMRQLNKTGWMHNRVRMIVASFLIKDLDIDWRWGEKYFAQNLIDYDPSVNNGNWQWTASTGCDAQPYFRIFNPWRQQEKFDPQAAYIKEWVPELKDLNPKEIHKYAEGNTDLKNYPKPIVEHNIESKKAIEKYKKTP